MLGLADLGFVVSVRARRSACSLLRGACRLGGEPSGWVGGRAGQGGTVERRAGAGHGADRRVGGAGGKELPQLVEAPEFGGAGQAGAEAAVAAQENWPEAGRAGWPWGQDAAAGGQPRP